MSNEIDDLLNELTGDGPRGRRSARRGGRDHRARRPFVVALVVLGGVVLAAAVAAGGFWLGARNLDDETTAAGPVTSAADQSPAAATDEVAGGDPAAPPTPTTEPKGATLPTVSEPPSATLPPIEATEDNPEAAIRYAVFSKGTFYLRGFVQSREDADTIVAAVAVAAGPENVVDEYVINPAAPREVAAPVYIEDVILFDVGSAELRPEFRDLLDLAPAFLSQNPNLRIRVVARTDASGSEEANLDLARRRAQAVIDYYLSIGVDPSQVEADPRGEEGFEETDDPETAAGQRRIEFVVSGLFE